MKRFLLTILCALIMVLNCFSQEDEKTQTYENQVSTNMALPFTGSFDVNYERTLANKWAVGIGVGIYGKGFSEFNSNYSDYGTALELKSELNPFVRVYFQGAQNKSHFLELFGSLSRVEESGRFARSNNDEGFGVYIRENRMLTLGGLGAGYGYRFLLLEDRLVLELQVGYRTNFRTNFILPAGAPVRGGIKVGYRF